MNRLSIGRFIKELLDDMHRSLHDPACPIKFLVYSGHDSTLVPVLCALGMYDDSWPPYAAYLSLEIACNTTTSTNKQDDGSALYVRAKYLDKHHKLFDQSSEWCPYSLFVERLSRFSITPHEYRSACSGGG